MQSAWTLWQEVGFANEAFHADPSLSKKIFHVPSFCQSW